MDKKKVLDDSENIKARIKAKETIVPNYDQSEKEELLNWLNSKPLMCSPGIVRNPISHKVEKVGNSLYEKVGFLWTDEDVFLISRFNAPITESLKQMLFGKD